MKTACAVLLAFLAATVAGGYAGQAPPKGKVNINTAPAAELETLPRIGPKVAQRIVDYRAKNGEFKRVEEIMKVRGIGQKLFDLIKDRITVGPEPQAK
jgi:competence protein ComEA